ncbi:uncharacterized protein [Cicer arietinum]|uniref:uncharacterized protein isoform X1 n=1 Tax=Cicer arietinum TaxID=3827 RepID=UPI003CC673F5
MFCFLLLIVIILLYNRTIVFLYLPLFKASNFFVKGLESFSSLNKITSGDGEESKMQTWLQIEPRVKHFESLLIPMYASAEQFLVSSGKDGSNKDVMMVDPVEAKRLAAKQMERIKAKEKLKRRRQIEAINGAWAMIGLTAGLVIEAQTGKSIMTQLQDYFGAIFHLFVK